MLTAIAAIQIGERHRKDLGDLQSLARQHPAARPVAADRGHRRRRTGVR
jgi:hypothetical protein